MTTGLPGPRQSLPIWRRKLPYASPFDRLKGNSVFLTQATNSRQGEYFQISVTLCHQLPLPSGLASPTPTPHFSWRGYDSTRPCPPLSQPLIPSGYNDEAGHFNPYPAPIVRRTAPGGGGGPGEVGGEEAKMSPTGAKEEKSWGGDEPETGSPSPGRTLFIVCSSLRGHNPNQSCNPPQNWQHLP